MALNRRKFIINTVLGSMAASKGKVCTPHISGSVFIIIGLLGLIL